LRSGSAPAAVTQAGRIGRDVYTYLHLPIVAGIVLAAVGDELVITHPRTDLHTAGSLVTLGGPALYLAGVMACAARIGHAQRPTRVAVTILLVALIPLGARTTGLVVAAIVTALLGFLVLAEQPRERLTE